MDSKQILSKLGDLGDRFRKGLVVQHLRNGAASKRILDTISASVEEQYLSDMKQMLADLLHQIPDDESPKQQLERKLKIQELRVLLSKNKKRNEKKSDPRKPETLNPQTAKRRATAGANLKDLAKRRARKSPKRSGQKKEL